MHWVKRGEEVPLEGRCAPRGLAYSANMIAVGMNGAKQTQVAMYKLCDHRFRYIGALHGHLMLKVMRMAFSDTDLGLLFVTDSVMNAAHMWDVRSRRHVGFLIPPREHAYCHMPSEVTSKGDFVAVSMGTFVRIFRRSGAAWNPVRNIEVWDPKGLRFSRDETSLAITTAHGLTFVRVSDWSQKKKVPLGRRACDLEELDCGGWLVLVPRVDSVAGEEAWYVGPCGTVRPVFKDAWTSSSMVFVPGFGLGSIVVRTPHKYSVAFWRSAMSASKFWWMTAVLRMALS